MLPDRNSSNDSNNKQIVRFGRGEIRYITQDPSSFLYSNVSSGHTIPSSALPLIVSLRLSVWPSNQLANMLALSLWISVSMHVCISSLLRISAHVPVANVNVPFSLPVPVSLLYLHLRLNACVLSCHCFVCLSDLSDCAHPCLAALAAASAATAGTAASTASNASATASAAAGSAAHALVQLTITAMLRML